MFYFRHKRKKAVPKTVRIVASKIAKTEWGPVPSIIGIGPTNIMMPVVVWTLPYRIDEAMRKIIPTNISAKPSRNSFNGNVNRGVSPPRRL